MEIPVFFAFIRAFQGCLFDAFLLNALGETFPGRQKGAVFDGRPDIVWGLGESSKTGGILCKGRIFVCRPCRILPPGKGIFQGGTELSEKYFCLLRCQGDPEFYPALTGGYPVDIEQTCIECRFPGSVGVELGKV